MGYPPGTLFGVTALMRQVPIDAQAYAEQKDPKKDQSFENLRPLVTGKIPALFVADTARDITRATRIADEFSMPLIIEGGREGYRELDTLKQKNIPVILSLDVADAPSRKVDTGLDATPQAVLDDRYDTWKEHSMNPSVLDAAGIKLAFSLGGGFTDYLKGVRAIVKAGLSRESALKAMTSGAAAILGVGDKTGTIEIGKLANLTVMSGDFVDDKSTIQRCVCWKINDSEERSWRAP